MPQSTKQRILETSRKLFNQNRYGNVKTSDIADALDISVGNLWYHYKDRRSILEAIASDFINSAGVLLQLQPKGNCIIDEFIEFITAFYAQVEHYQFLFRDQADFGAYGQEADNALPKVHTGTLEQFCAYIKEMKAQGKMAIQDENIYTLAETLAVQVRYSLEFYREGSTKNDPYEKIELKSVNMLSFVIETFLVTNVASEFRQKLTASIKERQQKPT